MDLFSSDESFPFSSLEVNRDAHCNRVGALAREIGRFFEIPNGPTLLESLAWLHDCPPGLLSQPNGTSQMSQWKGYQTKDGGLGEQIASGILMLQGEKSGDDDVALAAEIVILANSFDETIEWLQFEHQTLEQVFNELAVINEIHLWRPEVDAALRLLSRDLLDQTLVVGNRLPVSALAIVRSLVSIPTETLTVETLYRTAAQDPALAGDLLRVVNSWGQATLRRKISSLKEAVIHLGTEQARNVLLSSASRALFASSAVRGLWKHSVEVAAIAADLGTWCGYDREDAFLAGLMHDVGRLVIEKLDRSTLETRARLLEQNLPTVWVDLLTCWHDHGEIGGALLNKWNLPPALVEAVSLHHLPERSEDKLTSIIYLAELRAGENEDFCSSQRTEYALSMTGLLAADVQRAGIGDRNLAPAILAC